MTFLRDLSTFVAVPWAVVWMNVIHNEVRSGQGIGFSAGGPLINKELSFLFFFFFLCVCVCVCGGGGGGGGGGGDGQVITSINTRRM